MFEGVNVILKRSGQGLQESVKVVVRSWDGHTECGKTLNRLRRHGFDSAFDTGLRNTDAGAMEGTDDTAWCARRMKEDTDGNLKCIALLLARIQDDTSESCFPLFAA